MHMFATFMVDETLRVANQRIADRQREARNERLVAGRPRRSIADVVRGAALSLRAAMARFDPAPPALPTLADYPYRP